MSRQITFAIFFILTLLSYTFEKVEEPLANDSVEKMQDIINWNPSLEAALNQIDDYKQQADEIFATTKNSKLGESYWYDSIPNLLSGHQFDHLIFTDVEGKTIDLKSFNKPILLQVSTADSGGANSLLPAFNKLVTEFGDQVAFVILLCGGMELYPGYKENYNPAITIVPSRKRDCGNKISIQGFKHAAGYPFNYFLDKNLKIVSCRIGDVKYQLIGRKFLEGMIRGILLVGIYLIIQYFISGSLNVKSAIFSFGVMMFIIITGLIINEIIEYS